MLSEPVLVDAGPLVAIYNVHDPHHAACCEQLKQFPLGKTYTCLPAVTEAAYLLRRFPEFRDDLLRSVLQGEFLLLPFESHEMGAVLDIFRTYDDQQVDLTDAVLLYLSARESIEVVFTLDVRHFSVFRKPAGRALRILPVRYHLSVGIARRISRPPLAPSNLLPRAVWTGAVALPS